MHKSTNMQIKYLVFCFVVIPAVTSANRKAAYSGLWVIKNLLYFHKHYPVRTGTLSRFMPVNRLMRR